MNELEQFVEARSEQLKRSLSEIQSGVGELTLDSVEEQIGIVSGTSSLLDDLYCLREIQDINRISQVLSQQSLRFENEMIKGRWSETTGDDLQANAFFQTAHQ